MHLERTMQAAVQAMAPALSATLGGGSRLTPEQQSALEAAASESSAAMLGKTIDRLAPIIAETFTETELRGLVAFYEGPTGQAAVAKLRELMARFGPAWKELMPLMEADMLQRICARIECSKLPNPPGPA